MTQLAFLDVRRRRCRRARFAHSLAVQLTGNRLVAIPPEIGRLTSLRELYVSRCSERLASDLFFASSAKTRSWPCLARSDGSQRSNGWT